eukprot:scaffold13966_cov110-Skeletonema_dohrnii-CCMP3373.AAC.6
MANSHGSLEAVDCHMHSVGFDVGRELSVLFLPSQIGPHQWHISFYAIVINHNGLLEALDCSMHSVGYDIRYGARVLLAAIPHWTSSGHIRGCSMAATRFALRCFIGYPSRFFFIRLNRSCQALYLTFAALFVLFLRLRSWSRLPKYLLSLCPSTLDLLVSSRTSGVCKVGKDVAEAAMLVPESSNSFLPLPYSIQSVRR